MKFRENIAKNILIFWPRWNFYRSSEAKFKGNTRVIPNFNYKNLQKISIKILHGVTCIYYKK